MYGLSAITTFVTISIVGGPGFVLCALLLGSLYYNSSLESSYLLYTLMIL